MSINVIFDGPPGPEAGRFVEVEDGDGKSIRFGQWIQRPDGYWALQFNLRYLQGAVAQTRPTNCFQACVATVLGVPIEDVPDACDGAKWDWDAFQDWLALRGMQAIEIGFGNGGTIYPVRKPVLCIITGESPRTGRHAVVGELLGLEGFRLLHDPHPSGMWIKGEPTHAVFFVDV